MSSRRARRTARSTTDLLRAAVSLFLVCGLLATSALAEADPRLAPYLQRRDEGGARERVLVDMEAGVAAMEIGDLESAAAFLEDAIRNIEAVFSESPGTLQAQKLWFEEGKKEFKGEPYERVMAYFYRGLLHLMAGEWESARSTFTAGVSQDRFGSEEQYVFDFALMIFLQGWVGEIRGDSAYARARWAEIAAIAPGFVPPPPGANVLVIVETGHAPRKVADGVGHYQLKYRRGRDFNEVSARLDPPFPAEPLLAEDLYFQASTRGARLFDGTLRVKGAHRQRASDIGMALADAGASIGSVTTAGTGMSDAAGVAQLLGSIALLYSSRVKPKADVRYWRSLPDTVHVFAAQADRESVESLAVTYFDEAGAPVELPSTRIVHWVSGTPDRAVVWIRSRSALDVTQSPKGTSP